MRRIATMAVVAALAITLIVTSLLPAEATHTLGHLRRQIARLENQVGTLQQQVKSLRRDVAGLNVEVFRCEFFDDASPTTFADGSVGFPLYEDSRCAV
jgi:cell division protein FtsB